MEKYKAIPTEFKDGSSIVAQESPSLSGAALSTVCEIPVAKLNPKCFQSKYHFFVIY